MKRSALGAVLLCLTGLAGCAQLRPAPPPGPPPLMAPRAYGRQQTLRQQVTITHEGKTRQFTTLVQIKPRLVRIIWFGTMGARLFSIQWDGTSMCIKAPEGLPGALSPAWLLADVQAVYAPLPALHKALARSGWQVIQSASGERLLQLHGQTQVRVDYAHPGSAMGTVRVSHPNLGLRINIDSKPLGAEQRGGSQ